MTPIKRRSALSIFAGAIYACTVGEKEGEWITIAHDGINKNGRTYPGGVLHEMWKQLLGVPVGVAGDDMAMHLDAVWGIVTDVQVRKLFDSTLISVQVKWFSERAIPIGSSIVPWGVGAVKDGIIQPGYQLKHLQLEFDNESAFQKATRV